MAQYLQFSITITHLYQLATLTDNSQIAQRSNRSPQRSLEHLQEFPKLLSNPWFLERCEKISLQQLIIQSPNILGVGKNPSHPRNFTRRTLMHILRGAKVATFSSFPRPSFAVVSVVAPLFFVEGRGSSPLPTKEEVKTIDLLPSHLDLVVFLRLAGPTRKKAWTVGSGCVSGRPPPPPDFYLRFHCSFPQCESPPRF